MSKTWKIVLVIMAVVLLGFVITLTIADNLERCDAFTCQYPK
jgi:hypothetical protein